MTQKRITVKYHLKIEKKHCGLNRRHAFNIVLIGFMGCGKSSVVRALAQSLGFDFVDTDEMIEKEAFMTIPEIFEKEGERGFRCREHSVLEELSSRSRMVVSTGGGIVTMADNHELLRKLGWIVWLDASNEVIWDRVQKNNQRPLLQTVNPRQTIDTLLEQRKPLYESLADLRVESGRLSIEEIVFGISESSRVRFLDVINQGQRILGLPIIGNENITTPTIEND